MIMQQESTGHNGNLLISYLQKVILRTIQDEKQSHQQKQTGLQIKRHILTYKNVIHYMLSYCLPVIALHQSDNRCV